MSHAFLLAMQSSNTLSQCSFFSHLCRDLCGLCVEWSLKLPVAQPAILLEIDSLHSFFNPLYVIYQEVCYSQEVCCSLCHCDMYLTK